MKKTLTRIYPIVQENSMTIKVTLLDTPTDLVQLARNAIHDAECSLKKAKYELDNALKQLAAQRDRAEKDEDLWQFQSPFVRDGYDTILGYLAGRSPQFVRTMKNPAQDTVKNGRDLAEATRRRKPLHVIRVASPTVLHAAGIHEVNAYPLRILADYFDLVLPLVVLKEQRAATHLRYINSDWEMGPKYRRDLDQLDVAIFNQRARIADWIAAA